MKLPGWIVVILLPIGILPAKGFADVENYSGTVYDIETSKKRFSFKHEMQKKGDKVLSKVTYKDLNGEVVLVEEIETRAGNLKNYNIKQLQTHRSAHIYLDSNNVHFYLRDLKTDKIIKKEKKDIPESKIAVGSTIFNLVDRNSEGLAKDKDVDFSIALWGRQDLIDFYLRRENLQGDILTIHMLPSNFFIRQFVDTIEIKFDRKTQKIVSYKGRTNLMIKSDGEWKEFDGLIKISEKSKLRNLTND